MRFIEGFEAAKAVLSRQEPTVSYPVSPALKEGIKKVFGAYLSPEEVVKQIVGEVRLRGDAALFDYILRIDGVRLTRLEVTQEEIKRAYNEVSPELVSALGLAAEQIRNFHLLQKENIWREIRKPGSGQLVRSLERVGVYVPGGSASYPSTVLMTAIPAGVAGVREIILATPPRADGAVSPAVLVASDIAGVDRVFCVGGAQAIAALAYGTQSVPKVDKICGPGNIFVVLAKKLVYGVVAIDGLEGPSEVFVIADETADVGYCAGDLLAQAEHDPLASAILVTTSKKLADQVNREVDNTLKDLSRQTIARQSWEERGMLVVVDSVEEALKLANLYAPEHLVLMVEGADSYLDKVNNAGCVFLGTRATVVLGDYVAGPSHALPTGGTARFASPLNICDFIKFINTVGAGEADFEKLARAAVTIAEAEGFDAHARAMRKRLKAKIDKESNV